MSKNIVICGVGGQGTVLASKLIAAAAMKKGIKVMSAETIGMAQRGGSVFSHLRLGDDVCTPMIESGGADILIGFEPGEAVRMLPYLKKDGCVIVSNSAVMPVTASLLGGDYSAGEMIDYLKSKVSDLKVIDPNEAMEELGSYKILNTLMLGAAAASGKLGLSIDEIESAMLERLPEKFHELNKKSLRYFE